MKKILIVCLIGIAMIDLSYGQNKTIQTERDSLLQVEFSKFVQVI